MNVWRKMMQLTNEQIAECQAVALRRKKASTHRSKRTGEATMDQETKSVLAEYAFALALGYEEDHASEHIASYVPTPGYQFQCGENTVKVCATSEQSKRLMVKSDRTEADFYVLARVSDGGNVEFTGWASRDYLVSNEPIQGNWGPNYEIWYTSLNKMPALFSTLK
jgi:hypothetical protein